VCHHDDWTSWILQPRSARSMRAFQHRPPDARGLKPLRWRTCSETACVGPWRSSLLFALHAPERGPAFGVRVTIVLVVLCVKFAMSGMTPLADESSMSRSVADAVDSGYARPPRRGPRRGRIGAERDAPSPRACVAAAVARWVHPEDLWRGRRSPYRPEAGRTATPGEGLAPPPARRLIPSDLFFRHPLDTGDISCIIAPLCK